MGPSAYRSADFKFIHGQQFTLIKQFTDLLFSENEKPLVHGGMVLFSTSGSNNPSRPTFDLLVEQIRAQNRGETPGSPSFPMPKPYSPVDTITSHLLSGAKGVEVTEVGALAGEHTKALMQYYASSGLFQMAVTPKTVADLRALTGGGIIGELAKVGKRITA
jgi:small subunit ribosomal protein S29